MEHMEHMEHNFFFLTRAHVYTHACITYFFACSMWDMCSKS